MSSIDSMSKWSQIIRTLQSQRLELLKISLRIQTQANAINHQSKHYSTILHKLNDSISNINIEYKENKTAHAQCKLDIISIYDQITKLNIRKKMLEKELHTKTQNLGKIHFQMIQYRKTNEKLKEKICAHNSLLKNYKIFSQLINNINKQYMLSSEIIIDNVKKFEPFWFEWNVGNIVTWFENINNGEIHKMGSFKFFRQHIISSNICGKDLQNLNDVTLRMCGFKELNERNVILGHLQRLFKCGVDGHSSVIVIADDEKDDEETESEMVDGNVNGNGSEMKMELINDQMEVDECANGVKVEVGDEEIENDELMPSPNGDGGE